ncbi:MAG: hypothetical protein EXR75_13690 [Myxococcales bacterium]|nr:hypothetical protein [Myxococcales bacterium]
MPPLKYFVPNTFTALSLLLGLASVTMSAKGNFELAAWMILWGTLLDKADGTAARLCKATSEFGVQFDSFADFVSFGIAPAALYYYRVGALHQGETPPVVAAAAGLYALALAVRLARFNITVTDEPIFLGIPGTLMGALLASGYLTWSKYALPPTLLAAAPAILVGASALMISSIRIPKLKLRKNKAMNLFQLANVAAGYVLAPLMIFPEYLFGIGVVYAVGGVAWGLFYRPAPGEAEPESPEELAA